VTTEDDFQKQLDAHPDDHQTRLVFADWLHDRDDPRAEGIRALGARGMRLRTLSIAIEDVAWKDWYFPEGDYADSREYTPLPRDWIDALGGHLFMSRRDAEDAAALAFAQLPAERRAELLVGTGTERTEDTEAK
jgi:uncharacterized protein (TIGR02996 family)